MENLAKILAHLEKSESFYLAATTKVPVDRWLAVPAGAGWSAGEISAHLVLIEQRIVTRMAKILEKSPVSVPFWKRFHLPASLGASRLRRVKSSVPIDPSTVIEKNSSLALISAARAATVKFIEGLDGKNLQGYRYPHPFLGSLNVGDWLYFIGYHQIRHGKQILELVKTFQI